MKIELTGYDGLVETSIFKGTLAAGSKHEIDTPYRGLALLVFAGGQRYPLIIGSTSFALKIAGPAEPPSFAGSDENELFYKSLTGGDPDPRQYYFALLMIRAKELLESSHTIKTVEELQAKKKEFHDFFGVHYERLRHSDMLVRLIGQYFMMHEYVDYHRQGAPAADIRIQYQKEVLNGIGNMLGVFAPYFAKQEIVNYCVSLYYKRSMVTLAGLIIENFKESAFCPGTEKEIFDFPGDLLITGADESTDRSKDGIKERTLADLKVDKLIAFVSDDCPVSLVATIIKARQLANQKEALPVIVAPLEKLSENHLAMSKMIHGGNLLFINDEEWRKDNLATKIKLPLFIPAQVN